MLLTDKKIKQLAKDAGFWGVECWWDQTIPRFRRFITAVLKELWEEAEEENHENDY